MKKISCALMFAAFCVPALCADDQPAKSEKKMTKEEMLEKYDLDKNGRLDASEKAKMKEDMKKEKEKAKEESRKAKKAAAGS